MDLDKTVCICIVGPNFECGIQCLLQYIKDIKESQRRMTQLTPELKDPSTWCAVWKKKAIWLFDANI